VGEAANVFVRNVYEIHQITKSQKYSQEQTLPAFILGFTLWVFCFAIHVSFLNTFIMIVSEDINFLFFTTSITSPYI